MINPTLDVTCAQLRFYMKYIKLNWCIYISPDVTENGASNLLVQKDQLLKHSVTVQVGMESVTKDGHGQPQPGKLEMWTAG